MNTARPTAAPGDALRPLATRMAALRAAGSNWSRNSWSTWPGSMRTTASALVMTPSATMSMAIRTAAAAVRLALRVWSMYSLPRSMVNSRSWTSR